MTSDIDSNITSIIHIEDNTNIPSNLDIIDYDETETDDDETDDETDDNEKKNKSNGDSNTIKTKKNNSMTWNKSQLKQLINALKSGIISYKFIAKEITPQFPHKIVTGTQVSSKLQQIRRTERINQKGLGHKINKKKITEAIIKGLKNAIDRLDTESETEKEKNHRILNFTNANGHQMKRNFINSSPIIQSQKKYKVDPDLHLEKEEEEEDQNNETFSLNSNIEKGGYNDNDDDDDDYYSVNISSENEKCFLLNNFRSNSLENLNSMLFEGVKRLKNEIDKKDLKIEESEI